MAVISMTTPADEKEIHKYIALVKEFTSSTYKSHTSIQYVWGFLDIDQTRVPHCDFNLTTSDRKSLLQIAALHSEEAFLKLIDAGAGKNILVSGDYYDLILSLQYSKRNKTEVEDTLSWFLEE